MTLSEDMLAAADTIETLNAHYNYGEKVPWQASELRREAPFIADEEREEAERVNQVHDLAASIYEAMWGKPFDDCMDRDRYLATATVVVDCGWIKHECPDVDIA
jgi:hypothetical protein